MTHSLIGADRNTHARIVAASLICATVFVAGVIAARVHGDGRIAQAPAVLKVGKSTVLTSGEAASAVR